MSLGKQSNGRHCDFPGSGNSSTWVSIAMPGFAAHEQCVALRKLNANAPPADVLSAEMCVTVSNVARLLILMRAFLRLFGIYQLVKVILARDFALWGTGPIFCLTHAEIQQYINLGTLTILKDN